MDVKTGRLIEKVHSLAVNTARCTENGEIAGSEGIFINHIDKLCRQVQQTEVWLHCQLSELIDHDGGWIHGDGGEKAEGN